jgi:hypothetical protein
MGFVLFVSLILVGCNQEERTIEVNEMNETDANEVKQIMENYEEIYGGRAIIVDDQLLVAVQSKPWLDYKKTKIEKNLKKQLEERLPDYEVTVSADFKLYWETEKLLDETDEEKIVKKVEKLKKLKEEET